MDLLSAHDMLGRDLLELDRRVLDDLRQLRHLIQIEIKNANINLDSNLIGEARQGFFKSLTERERVAARIDDLLQQFRLGKEAIHGVS